MAHHAGYRYPKGYCHCQVLRHQWDPFSGLSKPMVSCSQSSDGHKSNVLKHRCFILNFHFYLCLYMCICVWVSMDTKRGFLILFCTWSYRMLWAAQARFWEPSCPVKRTAGALNQWTFFLVPNDGFFCLCICEVFVCLNRKQLIKHWSFLMVINVSSCLSCWIPNFSRLQKNV